MSDPLFVNTNVSALQSVFDLQNTTNSMDDVLQQLSTGYQINSAADNPAGLAISQEMQTQISGLNQANENAQNGISLLQTADGAMSNIDSILQSMYSLASQAASGTNDTSDLQALQQEMNQYAQEITNISNTTQFNNLNLLSGAFGGQVDGSYNSDGQYNGTLNPQGQEDIQIGANAGETIAMGINPVDAVSLGVAGMDANYQSVTGTWGTTPTASNLSQYITGLGSGLYDPASTTNDYTVGVTASTAVTLDAAATSGLGAAGTAISLTTLASADAAGKLIGTFTGSSSVQYTVTIVGGTSGASTGTVQYTVSGSDGFTSGTLTTTSNGTATVGDNAFSFNDTIAGASITLYGAATSFYGTAGYEDGQSASFTLDPATTTLGLFQGGTAGSNTVGSAVTLYGSQIDDAGNLALGSTTSAQQLTLTDFAGLLGSSNYGSTNGNGLINVGGADFAAASFEFEATPAGSAATVAGAGQVTTAATVSSGINIETQANAQSALTVISSALTDVNAQRAILGAYQNELQFASSNAQTGSNNLSSAQANILDTNMALQMANLSKYQVLQQSDVAMLAQADQTPQAILKLIG